MQVVGVGQVGVGWARDHGVSGEEAKEGGQSQLTKGSVSPATVSGLRAPGESWAQLCISSLQPVWRIDWTGLEAGSSSSLGGCSSDPKERMVATCIVAVGVARVTGS